MTGGRTEKKKGHRGTENARARRIDRKMKKGHKGEGFCRKYMKYS